MTLIKSSLDWNNLESHLLHKANGLSHGREVRKMIENIRVEVTELSRAEVLARRGNKHATDDLLNKVNQDIEMVEEYLLVAALIG